MAEAKRDQNSITTLLAVSNADGVTPVVLYADPVTHRLLTSSAASGDVSKVGTPVNNQVGVWTGDGTLEGDTALTFDTTTDTLATGILTTTGAVTATGAVTGSNLSGTNTGDQTNITGNAATVTTNANLTGHVTSIGNAAVLGSFTSLQLKTALTNETGSGFAVFATSPTLVTPVLGTPASGNLANCTAASLTQKGPVELTTTAEIDTGTDATRVMPVDQFVASKRNLRFIAIRIIAAGTDVAVDTTVGGDWICPFTGTLYQSDSFPYFLSAGTDTAGTTGTMVVDVHKGGTTIMTTNKLDIDTTEKSSGTGSTLPDLTTTAVTAGDIFTFDVDAIHTTAAKGLTIYMAIRLT